MDVIRSNPGNRNSVRYHMLAPSLRYHILTKGLYTITCDAGGPQYAIEFPDA